MTNPGRLRRGPIEQAIIEQEILVREPSVGSRLAARSGSWVTFSDRNAKQDILAVDELKVLERVLQIPISTWRYKTEESKALHMGPMAQDFHGAFGLGDSDRNIATVDSDGLALAAIQGLNKKLERKNAELELRIAQLATRFEELERRAHTGRAGMLWPFGLLGFALAGLALGRKRGASV
jgi:hypothetical protein